MLRSAAAPKTKIGKATTAYAINDKPILINFKSKVFTSKLPNLTEKF